MIKRMLYSLIPKSVKKPLLKQLIKLHDFMWLGINQLAKDTDRALHPKHRIIRYHRSFLADISPKDRVIDLGCGNGHLAYAIARKAKFVLGVDLNKKNIKFAQKRFKKLNLKFIRNDICKTDTTGYDVAVLSAVLEHIRDRISLLNSIKCKTVLVRVPAKDTHWYKYYKEELGLEWRSDVTHFTEYTEESLKDEISQTKYKIQHLSRCWGAFYLKLRR